MLTQLHIQNIAVIHKATIQFSGGFNVFTGETGAGKTMLINAIDAVLGERTSRDIIRTGEEKALVSALFEDISPRAREALEAQGYPVEDGTALIVREITAAGKNNCKINGMPANVSVLREIASLLIHIHGQRDSHQLLADEQHVKLIDLYGGLGGLLARYGEAYDAMQAIRSRLNSLRMDDAQKAQKIDMLTFQVNEIEAAGLEDPDEEESLTSRRNVIRNSETILSGVSEGYNALSGDDETPGINELFGALTEGVSTAARYMESLAPLSQRLEEIGYELTEAGVDLRNVLEEFEFDQGELDAIESRLDLIYRLKRKYGGDIREILEFYEAAAAELETIQMSDRSVAELEAELETAAAVAQKLGGELSAARREAAAGFIREVETELAYLDMPSVKLDVACEEIPLSPNGVDDIRFLAVTNVGEAPKPLSKIASGGEIARMMLAIKNVLADHDDIDTLIFDEVDTGVSGRAAQKIGAKLRQVSASRQVICVTHLAQVAAYADNHLYIYKEVDGERTYTRVETLADEGVYRELARITSGDLITDAALENARQLYTHAHQNA
ncbi:DNA repair protein RecN [Ruminococcaceae bacterium OttesenSCG-928-L11]|nr:DNA repair protein RecN [Ruminococcaceae bacterium OttesenSCG-928-L11]